MVSFAEILMNEEYSPMASGGPTFANVIISTINGQVSPAVGRYDYISIYKFSYDLLTLDDYNALRSFLILRQCGAQGFRFLAPDKNTATEEVITNAIDPANLVYRLVMNYGDAYNTYQRRIVKPYDVQLFIGVSVVDINVVTTGPGGMPLYGEGLYNEAIAEPVEFDYSTGIITLPQSVADTGAGQVLSWTGVFHLPCIFMDGENLAEHETTYAKYSDIYIRELLPSALGIS